jgi:large subunit ribosomal protein L24
MKKEFSKAWNSSTQGRKQRKYVAKAPLHIKHKFMGAPLSATLKKEYGFRSLPVRSGDTVKIMTGQFKGTEGKISKVSLIKTKVYVEGAAVKRADGSDAMYPIHASNVEIVKLDLSDKKRSEKIESLKVKEASK